MTSPFDRLPANTDRYVAEFGGHLISTTAGLSAEELVASTEMLSPLIRTLETGERLSLEFALLDPDGPPVAGIRGLATAASTTALGKRCRQLDGYLSALMRSQMPGIAFQTTTAASRKQFTEATTLRPRGRALYPERASRRETGPKLVAKTATSVLLPPVGISPDRVVAALEILRAQGLPAILRFDLRAITFDAAARRVLTEARETATGDEPRTRIETLRTLAETVPDDALMTALLNDGGGIEVGLTVLTGEPMDEASRQILCEVVFGVDLARGIETAELDLSAIYPRSYALSRGIAALVAVMLVGTKRSVPLYEPPASCDVVLGHTADGRPVALTDADRALHTYIIGATGTGKTTLVLNQIAADIKSGQGLIVLDPHGDLWEAARRLVPESRRHDLILGHLGDPALPFSLNVLSSLGGDPEVERSAAANALLRLFTRTFWVHVQEAFGPMFEQYFRNAILLLMEAQGEDATVLDFPRVFTDEEFRDKLLARCKTRPIIDFWASASRVTGDHHTLDNMTPWITSKMSPFVTNAALRPLLGATRSSLDLCAAIQNRKIVLINLAKGIIGEGASRLAGSLITMRLVASAQTQMRIPETDRVPFVAYLDEFQNYATEHLAEAIEETRKFKLRLVLACQSLGQITGGPQRADVANSVLANVANLVSFRLGVADAAILSRWFAPTLRAEDLIYLSNYRAVARLIAGGTALRPVEFKTPPPPAAA